MPKQPRSLDGKVAVVTGGARGIGRATAAALLAAGARVAIGDIDADLAQRTADELGEGVLGLALDVTSRPSFNALLTRAERDLGPLDVLVNCAGIMPIGDFVLERDAVTAHAMDVNFGGVALGSRLALERLIPRDTGHVVNLASVAGKTAVPGAVTYAASKFAVVGLTESLRAELRGTNVELHLIMPSFVATEMSTGVRGLRGIRKLTPERVADAIVDAILNGSERVYLPRVMGLLLASEALLPGPIVRPSRALLGVGRVLTRHDARENAAYQARIAPADAQTPALVSRPETAAQPPEDRAEAVANAAASVADALRARENR